MPGKEEPFRVQPKLIRAMQSEFTKGTIYNNT